MNINRKIAAHFLTMALVATALPGAKVFAGPPDPTTTRTASVTFADLDLSRQSDVRIARERINFLASKLCGRVNDPLSLSHHEAFLDCVAQAMAGAEPKLEKLASAQTLGIKLASSH